MEYIALSFVILKQDFCFIFMIEIRSISYYTYTFCSNSEIFFIPFFMFLLFSKTLKHLKLLHKGFFAVPLRENKLICFDFYKEI